MLKDLSHFIQNISPEDIKWKIKLLDNWKTILGPLGEKVVLLHIKEPLLVLGVPHPAWAQELSMMKNKLQQNINTFIGHDCIKQLQFQVMPAKQPPPQKPTIPNHQASQNYEHQFSIQEASSLLAIHDKDLRSTFKKYLMFCTQRNNSRNKQ